MILQPDYSLNLKEGEIICPVCNGESRYIENKEICYKCESKGKGYENIRADKESCRERSPGSKATE
jgi:hypothetical protein